MLYYNLKKFNKAIKHSLVAEAHLKGDLETQFSNKKHLFRSYAALGDMNKAFETQSEYIAINNSLRGIEKQKAINELEIQYDVKQTEVENELLKTREKITQKTIKNQTIVAAALILALIFAIGWGSFIYRANQQKKQLNEILEAKINEQTKDLQN